MKFAAIKSAKKPTATAGEGKTDFSFTMTLNSQANYDKFAIPTGTSISYEVYWLDKKVENLLDTEVITEVNDPAEADTATFSLTDLAFAGGKAKGTLYVRMVVKDTISGEVVAKSAGVKMSVKLP
jgi:hypothetical protein